MWLDNVRVQNNFASCIDPIYLCESYKYIIESVILILNTFNARTRMTEY